MAKRTFKTTRFSESKTPPKPKFIPANIPAKKTCPRCNGDGFWHTPKTGVRLATACADEVLVDKERKCPKCKGTGLV